MQKNKKSGKYFFTALYVLQTNPDDDDFNTSFSSTDPVDPLHESFQLGTISTSSDSEEEKTARSWQEPEHMVYVQDHRAHEVLPDRLPLANTRRGFPAEEHSGTCLEHSTNTTALWYRYC